MPGLTSCMCIYKSAFADTQCVTQSQQACQSRLHCQMNMAMLWDFVSVDDICLIQSFGGEICLHLSQIQEWQQLCGSHFQEAALVSLAYFG